MNQLGHEEATKATRDSDSRNLRFEKIWKAYFPRLTVFVRGMIGREELEAEDLVQEILLKVFENLDRYKSLFTLTIWSYSIARNHCLDALAKAGNYRKLEDRLRRGEVNPNPINPEDQMLHAEQ
jgi:RNA polymerase sigma factor (sigma-70 family)